MSLIKSRRRIKNANGEYDIVYHETSTDLVRHNDGNTVADHMNGRLASTDGVHGFRYNETDKTFEFYNPVNDTWSKVGSPMFAFAEEYSAESVYAIGEYCIKDGALYKANQAITTAEEWTEAHWTETSVATELEAISTTLQNKADKSVAFTVTLTAAGWSDNSQTISNEKFMSAGYAYTVAPASVSFADYADAMVYADDVTADGQMVFHCDSTPTADLTVNIVRMVTAE